MSRPGDRAALALALLLQNDDNRSAAGSHCVQSGRRTPNMPPVLAFFSRLSLPASPRGRTRLALGAVAALHVLALAILLHTETSLIGKLTFLCTWGLLNGFWLVVLRRPGLAAALSLGLVVVLILLSQFKHDVVLMTASFVGQSAPPK